MKPEPLMCCTEVFQNSRDGALNLYRHIMSHHVRNVTHNITQFPEVVQLGFLMTFVPRKIKFFL